MTENNSYQNKLKQEIIAIENAYSRGGKYFNGGKPLYKSQAVRLEDMLGIPGIAGRFKLPNDKAHDIAEYDYRKEFLKYSIALARIQKNTDDPIKLEAAKHIAKEIPSALKLVNLEIAKITKLNPELKRLDYNKENFVEAYRSLIGITSQYNVDDINAYLINVRENKPDEKVLAKMDELKTKGCRFGWQPAYSTLEKIETALLAKEQSKNNAVLNKIKGNQR